MDSMHHLMDNMRKCVSRRGAFLRWPVDIMRDRVAATSSDTVVNRRAVKTAYPMRAVRYWWTLCALRDELRAKKTPLVIADVGCGRGNTRRFIGDMPDTTWIGLDWNANSSMLAGCGYSEIHACNLDKPLPLADSSVDVVVFLHVIEHLPRPEFTFSELARILRPGGVVLAGSPIAPRWAARYRQWVLRRQHRKAGKHINSLDPGQWRRLASNTHLESEVMTGTCLLRWSGLGLENYSWWLRLNQAWGALFPSLGNELYLAARKPMVMTPVVARPAARSYMPTLLRATGVAGAIALAMVYIVAHAPRAVRPVIADMLKHILPSWPHS